ncbi:MAG TPA: aminotransferase class V-fold PLP-dependent enzyme, partial [Thermoanaerobaculia bacterium]|nr:aminotransferase class V-fold PLP-dependent enzyme [Thermoanaerobaculia bacterium]
MNETERRARFPVVADWAYLNHAAIGPLTAAAARRLADLAHLVAASGDRHWPARNEDVEEARRRAARLLGAASPASIAFVENTGTALSLVAEGLPWRPGDSVVGAEGEYPANVYPWMHLARRGVELRRVPPRPDGRIDPADLLAACDRTTRVLALSWVQWTTGFRSDLALLAAACRERDLLFVVDVIQGLGALALDVEAAGVDVAAGSAHKWLLGPEGIAVLYLGPRAAERLAPARAGWRSVARPFEWEREDLDFAAGALALECGTLNVYGIVALGESIAELLDEGPAEVERRVLAAADRLAELLPAAGYRVAGPRRPGERSGIVSAVPPPGPDGAPTSA